MSATPEQIMREYVNSQTFSSTTEVMNAMKSMFGEVLQQVMKSELEQKLGYEKSDRISNDDEKEMSKKIAEHWTVRCRNWDMVLNQLNIMFSDRIAG